jgi:penicillin-binding protein 2
MPEYRRQWDAELKRKGLYKEPNKDSLKIQSIEDSLKFIKNENLRSKLVFKRDSLRLKLKTQNPKK